MEVDYTKLKAILKKYGEDTISEMIAILDSKGSKNLQKNIRQEVLEDLEYAKLVISMPSYAQWADTGRGTGVIPPLENIRSWCKDRGIPEAAAFPIARNIALFGTKQSAKDFLKVFYERFPAIQEEIKKAVTEDYIQILKQVVNRS